MPQTTTAPRKKTRLMTEGGIFKNLLLFAVPLILGNLLQQLYNTADSIIVGNFLGSSIASLDCNWVLIPIAMVIGYFIVAAEPAVHILNRQVEEITAGSIPAGAMNLALSLGVAVSLGLAMIRVLTGISIMWFLLPGYALSLALSFVVPKIFTSIAFDSGGVASGPMTATFLLPFAMGACDAVGGNVVTDAFGVVAMVAMTPLVTIQLLGVSYKRRIKHVAPAAVAQVEEIIELA